MRTAIRRLSLGFVLIALSSGGLLDVARIGLVNTAMYDVAIIVWLAYGFARSEVRDGSTNHLQTQRWERSLADLHSAPSPTAPDSLIPMFEGMVERAFSRSAHVGELDGQPAPINSGSKNVS